MDVHGAGRSRWEIRFEAQPLYAGRRVGSGVFYQQPELIDLHADILPAHPAVASCADARNQRHERIRDQDGGRGGVVLAAGVAAEPGMKGPPAGGW